ncbi:hypothetical protein EOA23_01045 [Mesorhizobium sp. M2A.F.Ca.ET.042.01.1.1]|nr:hypothetical protein EOA23_01045 [Mesorhizobium sp. M2A.F.Ca.ET.042.01.1.1]
MPDIRGASFPSSGQSDSPFHGNGEPLYLFVLTQFRTENRFTLFLELLSKIARAALVDEAARVVECQIRGRCFRRRS